MNIPFSKAYLTGNEIDYIAEVHAQGHFSGDGPFTTLCSAWLEKHVGCKKALITHSCTAALEMAIILADIQPGDEVIMPSFAFSSAANAVVLRGGTPVFIDVRLDTLNIDEKFIEAAISARTKAIIVVHYAGVACEMDVIMDVAKRFGLIVIEDAAQAIMASYKGRALGSIGDLGCYSFHQTKNIISGEGGALLINNNIFLDRAYIIREKGTNRTNYLKGSIDKYTWIDIGSSYLPGEIISAFLWAQLQKAKSITLKRLTIWNRYHKAFEKLERSGRVQRPHIPEEINLNGHCYFLILNQLLDRDALIDSLKKQGVSCAFHYVALDSSIAGLKYGRVCGDLSNTINIQNKILRLPLWLGMDESLQQIAIIKICDVIENG